MTTSTPTEARVSARVDLEDGRVIVFNSGDRVGLQVSNEEFAALVFLTAEQAGAISALMLRASTRLTHSEVARHLDAGDVEGAAQALFERLGG